jgi:hypothetical protein
MSFWTENSLEPKRNYRFKLKDGNETAWWWAKSVDKPSFDVSSNEYQLINHKFKYPGIVTWKPISITVVDVGDTINNLYLELTKMGYSTPNSSTAMKGMSKDNNTSLRRMRIEQLNGLNGEIIEEWLIHGAFITSLSMSKLDYSSDDLSEITIEISYDFAEIPNLNASTGPAAAAAASGNNTAAAVLAAFANVPAGTGFLED